MILKMPRYCADFKCSADKCTDSCCIGWEIDIDKKTAEYYKSVGGDFGEKLKNNIDFSEQACFKLCGERCPFLNERNLCEIYINLGEDRLCGICTEHPRYYEWFSGVKEGGVGMCCEEAARLILLHGGENGYTETEIPDEACDGYDTELYDVLCEARDVLSDMLRNENKTIKNTVSCMLLFAEELQDNIDNFDYALPEIKSVSFGNKAADIDGIFDILLGLEPINDSWKPFITGIKEKIGNSCKISGSYEKYIRNIGVYFLWRYFMKGVFDGEILSKVKLSVISMAVTGLIFMAEKADFERAVMLSKDYSKEIEYSEENLEEIYSLTYENTAFSSGNLTAIF